MAEVKILVEGYTSAYADGDSSDEAEKTCATISLVCDNNINIVVDPGILKDQQILIDVLAKEGLVFNDIDIVFITHSHLDHYRNIGMFARAKTLEYFGLWDGNKVDDWNEQFTKDIKIIKTPGHNYDHLTMLVHTKQGTVAVTGDVFWKESYPVNETLTPATPKN